MLQTLSAKHHLVDDHSNLPSSANPPIQPEQEPTIQRNIFKFVRDLVSKRADIRVNDSVKSSHKLEFLAQSLETATANTTPKGLQSNKVVSNNNTAWTKACKATNVKESTHKTFSDFISKLCKAKSMDHSAIWNAAYDVLLPYIQMHCSEDEHCYLARAVLAHLLLLEWSEVLQTQFPAASYP
jgi:hypothetical protein